MKSKLKKLLKQTLALSFLIVIFTSCDPAVEYNKIVQNDSDYDMEVITRIGQWYFNGNDTVFVPTDTIRIAKNTEESIYFQGGIGAVLDFKDCNPQIDSMPLLVFIDDQIITIPDVNKIDGWNFNIIEEYKNGGGVCECRIILTNEMVIIEY